MVVSQTELIPFHCTDSGCKTPPSGDEADRQGRNEMYRVVRTDNEVNDCLNEAMQAEIERSKYPGMSFEEGVIYAIKWLTDKDEPHPLED